MPTPTKLHFSVTASTLERANVDAMKVATRFFDPVQAGEEVNVEATDAQVEYEQRNNRGELMAVIFTVSYVGTVDPWNPF